MLKLETYFAIAFIVWNINGSQAKSLKDVSYESPLEKASNLVLKNFILDQDAMEEQIFLNKSLRAQDLNETLDIIQDQQANIQKLLVAQLGVQISLEKELKMGMESFKKAIPENFEERFGKMEEQQSAIQETLKKIPEDFEGKLERMESSQKDIQTKIETQKTDLLDTLSQINTRVVSLQFERIGSRLFHIDRRNKYDWSTAVRICREMGGYIAAIKDQAEMDAMKERLDDREYWLGINDIAIQGIYISEATGKRAKFLKWQRGEPNNDKNNEHCVELVRGEMNDITCSKKMYIICQADNSV